MATLRRVAVGQEVSVETASEGVEITALTLGISHPGLPMGTALVMGVMKMVGGPLAEMVPLAPPR